jgi:hypothetical protein
MAKRMSTRSSTTITVPDWTESTQRQGKQALAQFHGFIRLEYEIGFWLSVEAFQVGRAGPQKVRRAA